MMKKCVLTISFLAILSLWLYAAWFDSHPNVIEQPDGTVLDIFQSGDEFHNWVHDLYGFTIIRDHESGYWCWAIPSISRAGDVESSGLPIHLYTPQSLNLEAWINISEELYLERRATRDMEYFEYGSRTMSAPTTGTINNIVIFIRFSDQTEFAWTVEHVDNMFNNAIHGANSLHRYFYDASYQQLEVWGHFFPLSDTEILSYQSPNPRSFYDLPQGHSQLTSRLHDLLARAVNYVSYQIPSDLVIDSNGNGRVDNVIFMVRGQPGPWAGLLWSHRSTLHTTDAHIHGKRVWDYNFNIQAQVDNNTSGGVGLLVHEFGHTLGAPDFYRYNNRLIDPVGIWEVMSNQTNPPQSMTAHVKRKYMNWTPVFPTITVSGEYTLQPITVCENNHAFRINSPYSSNEHFVVEYRMNSGGLTDSRLPGSGLLVYRINPYLQGNAHGPPDEIYVYRPGGYDTSTNGTLFQAFYSLQAERTAINYSTSPAPFLADNQYGGLDITNIGLAGSDISFTVTILDSPPNIKHPPRDLTAHFDEGKVLLNWTEPESGSTGRFMGYKVFRDEVAISGLLTSKSFVDENVVNETLYTYNVVAFYINPRGESISSDVTVSNFELIVEYETTNFGVGVVDASAIEREFILRWEGFDPLTIKSLSIVGDDTDDFDFVGEIKLPITLLRGEPFEFVIAFTPTKMGNKTAVLNITDYEENTYTLQLKGSSIELLQPSDLAVWSENETINVSWDISEIQFMIDLIEDDIEFGFKVYRNDGSVYVTQDTFYKDLDAQFDVIYTYYLTAFYILNEGDVYESLPTSAISIVLVSKPKDLTAVLVSNTVTLTWEPATEDVDFRFNVYRRDLYPEETDKLLLTETPISIGKYLDVIEISGSYIYYISAVLDNWFSGFVSTDVIEVTVEEADVINEIPGISALLGNFPNPFNPFTSIRYQVSGIGGQVSSVASMSPSTQFVQINVYNVRGQRIRTLVNSHLEPGVYSVVWDGRDESGISVGSGVYFYKMVKQDNIYGVRRMLLLR